MGAERTLHLVAGDVGGLRCLLDVHAELDDVEEELEQILVLGVAALDGEREVGLSVLEGHARGQGGAGPLAGLGQVVRVEPRIEHEALHPLAHSDPGAAGDHRGDPGAARGHGHDPALGVGGLDRGRSGREGLLVGHARQRRSAGRRLLEALLAFRLRCRRDRRPLFQEVEEGVVASLEVVGVPRAGVLVVLLPVDRLVACAGVALRQQSFERLLWRVVGIAVVEVAVGEGEVHRLVEGVDVAGRVVAHRLEVGVLQDVQRLEHDRPLYPGGQLVHVDAAVVRADRLLDVDLPLVEIGHRDETVQFSRAAHELLGDVAAVEAVVGGAQGLLAGLALFQRRRLGLDQFAQRVEQVRLAEDLAGPRCGAPLAVFGRRQVGQEDPRRVRPLLEHLPAALHVVGLGALDRVAVRHLDRGFQDLGQAHRAVVREHDDQAARRSRRHRRERPVLRRVHMALLAVELDGRAGRRDAERVDPDHFALARIEDQGLGLAAPAQRVPHGRGRGQHGASGVDRVAAASEDQGAGRGGERFAGDRHPVASVQHGLDGALGEDRSGGGDGGDGERQNAKTGTRGRCRGHRGSLSPARGRPCCEVAGRQPSPLIACRSLT